MYFAEKGSYPPHLFECMLEAEALLTNGKGLMEYLTTVTRLVAAKEIGVIDENDYFLQHKMCPTIIHRLTGDVFFDNVQSGN